MDRRAVLNLCALGLMLVGAGLSSSSYGAGKFGRDGRPGWLGQHGEAGHDGEDRDVVADGSFMTLVMSGDDGRDGSDGRRGGDAHRCRWSGNPATNLVGARGGQGGQGGNGGRGGHGGDLTIRSENIEALGVIHVDTSPGRGGYPGYGGDGGRGCFCPRRSWKVKVNGKTRTFYCRPGADGHRGRHGRRGASGQYGTVKVINQLDPLPSDNTRVHTKVENLLDGTWTLGRNVWEQRTGTAELFARGSRVPPNYWFFMERMERSYVFQWQASRPIEAFQGVDVWLALDENNEISWTHSNGFWHDGETTRGDNGVVTYTITAAATPSDAVNISFGDITGTDTGLVAEITDGSGITEEFEHAVSMKYYTAGRRGYYLRWSGTVPSEHVHVRDGSIYVNIGELDIDSRYLRSGTYASVSLRVTRKMGDYSAFKDLSKPHRIGH